jgi:inosine-uridine nucleoside N-ribohydrolase
MLMFRTGTLRTALLLILDLIALTVGPALAGRPGPGPNVQPVFVDTDIGVDDAVAIAWLLEQRKAHIVGFSTVFGNTSNTNAARNLLTLFAAAGRSYPVTIGAAAPLAVPPTGTGALIHGPDGLWFAQQPVPIDALPTDAPAAIAAAARAHPSLTIVALGPLTNIALAVQQYPADLAGVRVVALGGANLGGNRTPVAEFNIHADPHALDVVLQSDVALELVTLDAFDQVTVDARRFPEQLSRRGGPVGRLLAAALGPYFQVQLANGVSAVSIPDVAAVIYALQPSTAAGTSALVRVAVADDFTRGQTVIATTINDRVSLIADDAELSALAAQAFTTPGFDLGAALFAIVSREPDNAVVVLDVFERTMIRLLERDLLR